MNGDTTGMPQYGSRVIDEAVSDIDRLQYNERIAHLQRRVRIQKRMMEKFAQSERRDRLAEMQVFFDILAELEERNIVLEDALKTARHRLVYGSSTLHGELEEDDAWRPQEALHIANGDPSEVIHMGRVLAESLRSQGNFKGARRALRKVYSRRRLKGIRLQLLAASRFRLVRTLFSFYRYK